MATFSSTAPFCRIPSGPFTCNFEGVHSQNKPSAPSQPPPKISCGIGKNLPRKKKKHNQKKLPRAGTQPSHKAGVVPSAPVFQDCFNSKGEVGIKFPGGDYCFPADWIFPSNPTINTCSITSCCTQDYFNSQLISRKTRRLLFCSYIFPQPYITKFHFNHSNSCFSQPSLFFLLVFIPGIYLETGIFTAQDFPHLLRTVEFCNIWCCLSLSPHERP